MPLCWKLKHLLKTGYVKMLYMVLDPFLPTFSRQYFDYSVKPNSWLSFGLKYQTSARV